MLTTIGLGLIKSSILVFYMNIFIGNVFVIAARVMLAIVLTWTVSFFFANLFTCYPITPFVEQFYYNTCMNTLPMWYAMSISDMIVDILILLLPIPMVLQLKLRPKQKIGVLGMFLLGATVCAFSVALMLAYFHAASVFLAYYNDETFYTSPVFFWANIELSSAIMSAYLPTYRPIWLRLTSSPQKKCAVCPTKLFQSNKEFKEYFWISKSGGRGLGSLETESQTELNDVHYLQSVAMDTRIDGGDTAGFHAVPLKGITVERSVNVS